MKILFVKTNPDICFARIQKRKRKGEEIIPLGYLQSCSKFHEEWINNVEKKLEINGNIDISENLFNENKYFNDILNKVYILIKI